MLFELAIRKEVANIEKSVGDILSSALKQTSASLVSAKLNQLYEISKRIDGLINDYACDGDLKTILNELKYKVNTSCEEVKQYAMQLSFNEDLEDRQNNRYNY